MESLILTEALAGLQAQALGLAERAGLSPEMAVLQPSGVLARLPARFWPDPLHVAGIANRDFPPLVIGCGGVAAAVLAGLRTLGIQVVQVQHPRMDPARFDLVVVNRHDRLTGKNVIVTRTALHRASAARLGAARIAFATTFAHLPRPLVCVLVGGSNGRFRFGATEGARLAAQLAAMIQADGVGVALTPSRRTEPAVTAAFRAALEPLGGFVWDGSGDNPYFGMLALADAIVVTGDSVSMISEAVATHAPVLVAPLPGRSRRIARFTDALLAEKRIRVYAGRLDFWPVGPLDDTDMAAEQMRARLGW